MIQDFYSKKIYLYSTTHFKNKEYLDVSLDLVYTVHS